jgi:chemotaxis protein histidine kinase CheA
MSISTIQTTIARYKREMADLSIKIADKRKRIFDNESKANKAYSDAQKSKNSSTINSKLREYERYQKEASRYSKELADLEKKRASKEKQLHLEETKLVQAQKLEDRKREREQQRMAEVNELRFDEIMKTVQEVQLEHSKLKELYPLLTVSSEEAYDVFISHASEDKESFVNLLVEELQKRGVKVWFDRKDITWGRSIRQSIDEGLKKSKFAIVVLSEFYIKKYWTNKEFNALFSLGSTLGEFILPIWYNITPEKAQEFSPMLSDTMALKNSEYTIENIADLFVEKLNYDNNG